jgi:hypothetical protein
MTELVPHSFARLKFSLAVLVSDSRATPASDCHTRWNSEHSHTMPCAITTHYHVRCINGGVVYC